MALLEPKQITLTSNVNGVKKEVTFNIGRYRVLDGIENIGLVAELLDSGVRKKTLSNPGVFASKLPTLLERLCKNNVELVTDDGVMALNTKDLINVAIPDVDIAFQLLREVHDYNTHFFSSANLLTKSQKAMSQAKELGTKMLSRLRDSLSAKK